MRRSNIGQPRPQMNPAAAPKASSIRHSATTSSRSRETPQGQQEGGGQHQGLKDNVGQLVGDQIVGGQPHDGTPCLRRRMAVYLYSGVSPPPLGLVRRSMVSAALQGWASEKVVVGVAGGMATEQLP